MYRSRVFDQLKKIDRLLNNSNTNDISLRSGIPGIILFNLYYYKLTGKEELREFILNDLDVLFDLLEFKNKITIDFIEGLTGIGWLLNHISNSDVISLHRKQFSAIDILISEQLYKKLPEENLDFLYGLSGILNYLIENNQESQSKVLLKIVNTLFKSLKKVLEKSFKTNIDESVEEISKVISPQIDMNTDLKINLSIAEGLTGVLAILLKLFEKNIHKNKSLNLIREITHIIMSWKYDPNACNSYFPSYSSINNNQIHDSRFSWNKGDLSILYLLLKSASMLKDDRLYSEILEMSIFTSHRKDFIENGLRNIWIYNGTSGVAYVFHKMFSETGIKDFRFASEYWYYLTLEYLELDDYNFGKLPAYNNWHSANSFNTGFLEGFSGLGLSLINSISDVKPNWDSALLLS